MKKIFFLFFVVSLLLLQNCKKENQNPWKIEIKNPAQKVEITDISKELYDLLKEITQIAKDEIGTTLFNKSQQLIKKYKNLES